jgi:hypothetical protein
LKIGKKSKIMMIKTIQIKKTNLINQYHSKKEEEEEEEKEILNNKKKEEELKNQKLEKNKKKFLKSKKIFMFGILFLFISGNLIFFKINRFKDFNDEDKLKFEEGRKNYNEKFYNNISNFLNNIIPNEQNKK